MRKIIEINHFVPAIENGTLRQKEIYSIVIQLLKERDFTCINKNEQLNQCIFKNQNINYQFSKMEAWGIDPTGNKGLDIDYIELQEVT